MIITENFALLDILRAIERLSQVSDGEKTAQSRGTESAEVSADTEKVITNQPKQPPNVTQSLLIRHERDVFRIKNTKK